MPLFFAYGSNMDAQAMARRCPASRSLGPAKLMGFRFIISSDGYATVVRDRSNAVWGLVWDLALADVATLDRYESLSTGLYTKVSQSVVTGQGPRRVMIYIGRSTKPGQPGRGYAEGVVEAAAQAGLPAEYLRELRTWLPKSPGVSQPSVSQESGTSQPEAQRPAVRPRWTAPSISRAPRAVASDH